MSSKTKTNTTKEEKSSLVPKLRFPEFRGTEPWAEMPLKRAAQINPTNSGLPESFIYIDLESVEAGKLKAKNRIAREGAPSRAQRLVERGDIIYQVVRPYQRNNLLCEFDDNEDYVASTGYAQLRAKGSNGFLYQSIHTDSFVGRVMAKCTGSNYPAINSSDLAEIQLPLPPTPAEQQKIAECLSSVDELMAAQALKVDALKTHKKGLMQQLFPREGETQPRLRFPEFQKVGKWEVWRFNKVFDRLKTKNTINEKNVLTISAQDGLVSQLDYFNKSVSSKDVSGYQLLTGGDFAYNKSYSQGYPWGAIKSLKKYESGVVSPLYICFRLLDKLAHSGSFFEQYFDAGCLDSELKKIAQEGARNHGMLNIGILDFFDRTYMRIPHMEEQQRIADCLSSLDAIIAAEIQKLEALKTHKKGLMQQLFPSLEDAA